MARNTPMSPEEFLAELVESGLNENSRKALMNAYNMGVAWQMDRMLTRMEQLVGDVKARLAVQEQHHEVN